ncbi:MAG: exodeoxyribonuclease VII small subunit [Alphaproteobacteria bacterium]|nr:exodeoxyribonuclease VII small subunit [Alphaproteobacteria bacterium]
MTNPKAVEKLSFEDALEELETIVRKLETGEAPLEDSITAYERGTTLKHHCEKKLRDAQIKIEKISISDNNTINTQPLDPEE